MEPLATTEQIRVDVRASAAMAGAAMADDIRAGLTAEFKELPPKYFYDERGSQLFERITELPEYYPTRAEREILETRSAEIVAAAGFPDELVELGSGSASKTRVLLDAMEGSGCLRTYVPVDISEQITRETAEALTEEYPGLRVHGIVCDFEHDLEELPASEGCLIAFLGGTIGNFTVAERRAFVRRIAGLLGPGDAILLGTDLVKDTARLEAAYNDSAGITAEFNKNLLHVLNREFGADFDPAAFEHVATYDALNERVDIRLRSLCEQTIALPGLGIEAAFEPGEEMRTELSCKFTDGALERLYASAGLELAARWTDPEGLFALSLGRRAPVF